MTIWVVAYEQVGECEIRVQVCHSLEEAEALAEQVAEELSELGDGYINTSITEYEPAELLAEINRLREALRDIARQPEGDEESAQAVANAALRWGGKP